MCLEACAFVLIFAFAIPAGVYSAWRPGSTGDRISSLVLFILYSLPSFWVATMLICSGSPSRCRGSGTTGSWIRRPGSG